MSLTSYRAAPPRVTIAGWFSALKRFCRSIPAMPAWTAGCSTPRRRVLRFVRTRRGPLGPSLGTCGALCHCDGFFISSGLAPASMPGDVLLFRGLSHSTIGAVRFHGRVRDGIGWVTDAMVTKQWSRRMNARGFLIDARADIVFCVVWL